MHIYFAGTQGFDAARAIAPGRGRSAESAAAWSLPGHALAAADFDGLLSEAPVEVPPDKICT